MILYKILSFIFPVKVLKKRNQLHTLELEWYNGKLMLNSAEANYSFGNLQDVFRNAFNDTRLNISPQGRVLLLGLGGGCVIDLLENNYHFSGYVKAVELDPEVVEIYQNFFSHNKKSEIEVMVSNAMEPFSYLNEDEIFDLIICDIFIDLQMPSGMLDPAFYTHLKKHLNNDGSVYVNTIMPHNTEINQNFLSTLWSKFKEVRKLSYFDLNDVYVLR